MPALRLRLRIQRNELPTVSTLWPVLDTHLKHTISQLLEAVNRIFPLESDTWGFEHYIVAVTDFECLHYHEIGAVFKDEDEVVIRPLLYAETRARTLLGRNQITSDGRHLVDGVPFGRPALRGVARPNVRIPALKRKRDLEGRELEEMEPEGIEQKKQDALIMRALKYLVESDEEGSDTGSGQDLEDAEAEKVDQGKQDDFLMAAFKNLMEGNGKNPDATSGTGMALVRTESDDDDDDEGDDGDFMIEDSKRGSTDGSSGVSDSDSSSKDDTRDENDESSGSSSTSDSDSDDSSTSEASWQGINGASTNSPERAAASKTVLGSRMQLDASGTTTHATSTRHPRTASYKRKSPSDEHETNTAADIVKKARIDGAPREGKPGTKLRNQRKRIAKHLQHLKATGVLQPDANFRAYAEWKQNRLRGAADAQPTQDELAANQLRTEVEVAAETSHSTFTNENSSELVKTSGMIQSKLSKHADIEEKRKHLLEAISAGGVDIGDKTMLPEDEEAPEVQSSKPVMSTTNGTKDLVEVKEPTAANQKLGETKATDMVPASVARRSKLDVASTQRLLYGSLGIRAPKTREERDALQKKLAETTRQRGPPSGDITSAKKAEAEGTLAEQQAAELDEMAWLSKIELSAVECCEEGVTLSTPPFPFYQRWDPQQRKKKAKGRAAQAYSEPNKRRKKGVQANGTLVEMYDKYNVAGGGDALDYDDAEEVEDDDDDYWEEGALLDEDLLESESVPAAIAKREVADEEVDDGFPPLPADISTLQPVCEGDALTGDFVVYTELVCSAATSWEPKMLTRTAKLIDNPGTVQDENDNKWLIQLANRDLAVKEYDREGKRVYRKFEMEDLSEDEDEEGEIGKDIPMEEFVRWADLGDVRLLLRPTAVETVVLAT
ncbi:hypothetical protein LTR62_007082 [Meristemomyces frigidus]|uniref:DUF7357 domain-containing protein n=1 Tax=Meristemomyces frigidus TaxID=1508187 RepID=A0AAN7YE22_9PEZI|nr:hypothetical protein LTR62_007082 [Meristemomyces frigidus]